MNPLDHVLPDPTVTALAGQTQVDGIFRDILAGRPLVGVPMAGIDEKSTSILNEAADVLCITNDQRKLLQMLYDLGRTDGSLQATKDALAMVPD